MGGYPTKARDKFWFAGVREDLHLLRMCNWGAKQFKEKL